MAEVRLVEVVDTGPGWNRVRASDGNVYTLRGDYNWRSNNPGNIEYGDFARSQGAIGSGAPPPGRPRGFAIFPTKEAGEQARIALQFESPSYRDKTISQAIARYAPSFENDTGKYVRIVSEAAGVSPNTRMRDLTPAQRQRFLEAQERFEGFRTGTIEAADGQSVPPAVVAQFSGTPLPPGNVGNTASAAIDNAVTPYERPPSFPSLNRAPTPMGYAERPRSQPQAVLPTLPPPRRSNQSPPPLPMDMELSGQQYDLTSQMDDSGQVLTPWFSDYPPTQALRPDIPSGGLAGQDGGRWNIPNVSVPSGGMVGQDRFTPRSLVGDSDTNGSDLFTVPQTRSNQNALQTALEGYIRQGQQPQVVRGGLIPRLPDPEPPQQFNIPQSLVGQDRFTPRQQTPSVPSGGLVGQDRFTPRPSVPSGGFAGQDGGVWRQPSPSVPSGGLVGADGFTPRPSVPSGGLVGQDSFSAAIGQNRLPPSSGLQFDPNSPPVGYTREQVEAATGFRLPAPPKQDISYYSPQTQQYETVSRKVRNPDYGPDLYNYVPPDIKMLMNFTPDEMATHKARMAAAEAPPVPEFITEQVQVPIAPPPQQALPPIPAPRPAIAPLAANAVDPEWNPIKRLFSAATSDPSTRPAVGTVLGTADNGGVVTQGHNGLLNSITQESDYWRRATGKSRSSGSSGGGGGARSLVGTR